MRRRCCGQPSGRWHRQRQARRRRTSSSRPSWEAASVETTIAMPPPEHHTEHNFSRSVVLGRLDLQTWHRWPLPRQNVQHAIQGSVGHAGRVEHRHLTRTCECAPLGSSADPRLEPMGRPQDQPAMPRSRGDPIPERAIGPRDMVAHGAEDDTDVRCDEGDDEKGRRIRVAQHASSWVAMQSHLPGVYTQGFQPGRDLKDLLAGEGFALHGSLNCCLRTQLAESRGVDQ